VHACLSSGVCTGEGEEGDAESSSPLEDPLAEVYVVRPANVLRDGEPLVVHHRSLCDQLLPVVCGHAAPCTCRLLHDELAFAQSERDAQSATTFGKELKRLSVL